jgi:hypothetical protein
VVLIISVLMSFIVASVFNVFTERLEIPVCRIVIVVTGRRNG